MLFLDVDCQTLLPLVRLIKNGVLPLIQWGIPILLILFGTLDLGKAVIASKEDEIKAAQKLLIKRLIYAIAVFFVVLIVQAVFGLLGNAGTGTDGTDYGAAGNTWFTCWKQA